MHRLCCLRYAENRMFTDCVVFLPRDCECGEDINEERNFKIFIGILFGPRDFPDFKRMIISDISKAVDGAVKKEFPTLSPMKSIGDFLPLGIVLVMSSETLTKYLLKMLAIAADLM